MKAGNKIGVDNNSYPWFQWNAKKGVKGIALYSQAGAHQDEIADVRAQGDHSLSLREGRLKIFSAADRCDRTYVVRVLQLEKAIHQIPDEVLLDPFGQSLFRRCGINFAGTKSTGRIA